MAKAVSLDAAKPAYEAGALAEDLTSGISKLKETQNLPFFYGAFAKWRKATVSFLMFVYLSVRPSE